MREKCESPGLHVSSWGVRRSSPLSSFNGACVLLMVFRVCPRALQDSYERTPTHLETTTSLPDVKRLGTASRPRVIYILGWALSLVRARFALFFFCW